MFGTKAPDGLQAGEIRENDGWYDAAFDDLVHRLTIEAIEAIEEGWEASDPDQLPHGFDLIPPGPLLSAALSRTDRSLLNGHDLIRTMQARERQVSHYQAGSMADAVEISYSAPGDGTSPAKRIEEAAEFASDEIRAALTLTRRSADLRLSDAAELRERLAKVWELLDQGLIDMARARVIARGTGHLPEDAARDVVDHVAERAPRLTTGQLAALIRRLCVDTDRDEAKKRYERAVEARRLWIEQTVDGTANLYLLDIPVATASAIGRRINGHMISLRKDGDQRPHDQLRADIACDLLAGADFATSGKGVTDIRIDLTTLAELDEKAGEIPGMGPVIADVARQVALAQQKAEWRVTVTDDDGQIVHTGITRRRPTAAQTRHIQSLHPTCTFPGCRVQAEDCDLDHEVPWAKGGPTTVENLSPKCRHDHRLKDHGWSHRFENGQHIWTSPMGHTYITNGQSP